MSRSRKRVDALRQICGLRAVAERLAEAGCAAATHEVTSAHERKTAKEGSLAETVSGWERSIATTGFDPASTNFWGHAINQTVLDVAAADEDVAHREQALRQAEQKMVKTVAERECADSLLSRSWKKHMASIEDRDLAEIADRFSRVAMRS